MASEREGVLFQAARECGLAECYIDCVRPLLREGPRPRCCGGGCEPCVQLLEAVAERVLEIEEGLTSTAANEEAPTGEPR